MLNTPVLTFLQNPNTKIFFHDWGAALARKRRRQLVLDQGAAPAPEIDALLDGQRWASDFELVDESH